MGIFKALTTFCIVSVALYCFINLGFYAFGFSAYGNKDAGLAFGIACSVVFIMVLIGWSVGDFDE